MDTDKLSIRNAFAAGITTGTGNVLFFPGASLNRRQIATFIYRALMYVRDNSGIRYTIYDSPLKNYTDSKKIASWATDLI